MLEAIAKGDQTYLKQVYEDMRGEFIAFLVRYFNTSPGKAKEIYPESFSKFYFNIKDGNLKEPLKSTLKTYLFAIGKNLFMKRNFGTYQKKIELKDQISEELAGMEELNFYEYDESKQIVGKLLTQIGENCRNLLTMIFINELKSQEVCEELEINSLGTLRKRKFDCLKKMRLLLISSEYKR